MEEGAQRSLEDTPTWAVSVFCLFLLILSFCIETVLHKLSEFLRKKKRRSLNKALTKTKTEMMKLGFLSFLLTISEVPVSKICINKAVANSFLPCTDALENLSPTANEVSTSGLNNTFADETANDEVDYCEAKGMVALVSSEGIEQLNIFISVLALFHILYCTLTMCLGMAKMRRWKRWEDETSTLEYQIANDPRRFQITSQTLVGQRHLKFWSEYPPLLWMVCFIRQFYGSVTKADYFTLRNGFLAANVSAGGNFNFQKFLARAYDEDFEMIVGIRFWIWVFFMLFIFLSAHEFYNHYWLPFIPLAVALVVGTKLQMIITKMCVESSKESPVTKGTLTVTPNDDYFWFGRPDWLLHLLQFILIQNSFQLAFFTWSWYEYGLRSCFNREKEDFAIRVAMGVGVQLLCAYVTLPLYALVTQMGSSMRKAVFTELVVRGLKNWHRKAKRSLAVSEESSREGRHSISLHSKDSSTSIRHSASLHARKASGSSQTDNEQDLSPSTPSGSKEEGEKIEHSNNVQEISGHLTSEITSVEESNSIIVTRGSYDGEISFGSSWKKMESSRGTAEISSIVEEDDSDILPEFIP